MSTPRLAMVVNTARFFLTHRLPLALEARRRGFDVVIVTPPAPEARTIREAGLEWQPLTLSRSSLNPATELRSVAQLAAVYRRLRPALVHHVTPKPVMYGTLAARAAGVPAVVNAVSGMGHVFVANGRRTPLQQVMPWLLRVVLRHPNMRVIFQNVEQRDDFLRWRVIRDRDAVLIRGAGVDPHEFRPVGDRDGRDGPPVVALVSRMLETKGVPDFVEAAAALRASGVDARFVLVGDEDRGNPASISRDRIRRWVDAGIVEYWGLRDDMPEVLRETDVVCLPSYYAEGLPKALIEAAACGLPIVTTDHPGCRDVVRHDVNGLLVPPRDVPALGSALRRLIDDPALRRRLGAAGRQRAIEEFSLDRVLAETMRVYEELLA